MDFDRVADELYSLPPAEFVAARDELAAGARAEGDAGLSAAIKELRKPTTSAWLANLLVRERARDVNQLIELGSDLRAAQAELAGDQLRELSRRRREIVTALGREGLALGRRAGRSVSDAAVDELEGTLEAAMAEPGAAEALRAGRLSSALRYAGTGLGEVSSTASARLRPERHGPGEGAARHRRAEEVREARAAAKAATKRASAARKSVSDVGERLSQARSALERARSEAEQLEREAAVLDERAAEANRQLREAEEEERVAQRQLEGLQADDR